MHVHFIKLKMSVTSTEEKLRERVKELTCMYQLSTVFVNGGSFDEMLPEIIATVKRAWRFSDDAIVELHIDKSQIISSPLPENTIFQAAIISLPDSKKSYIKVHYDARKYSADDFIEDEFHLLQVVAAEIGRFYEIKADKDQIIKLESGLRRMDRLNILGEITAGIAHELNTPLGNILGFGELIKMRSKDKQISQDIEKVINAAIYSREIVKKLMFFSCEMPYNMEVINIKQVTEQALKFLEPNFKKGGLSYKFEIQNSNLNVQIDSVQFTQILFNIIVNAIYVSPSGAQIKIIIYNDDEFCFTEIADEGAGIAEAIHEKIFEPFFTTKPFGEGTGLGLSVVHGIIKSHKGEISVSANLPKGTVFKIKLPIKSLL